MGSRDKQLSGRRPQMVAYSAVVAEIESSSVSLDWECHRKVKAAPRSVQPQVLEAAALFV